MSVAEVCWIAIYTAMMSRVYTPLPVPFIAATPPFDPILHASIIPMRDMRQADEREEGC